MSTKRWVVVSSLGLSVAMSCAKADDQAVGAGVNDGDGAADGTAAGSGGKLGTAGTTMEGGKSNAGGSGNGGASTSGTSAGGKSGAASGGASHAGSGGAGGSGAGGKAGAPSGGSGGSAGKAGSAGTSNGGSATGGSTGLGCSVEASGGAAASDGGAGGASAGGAGSVSLFFDDFEAGTATKWTTTLGTWAIVDDDSKAYEQSLQENKLQLAIATGSCFADQIIDARVKITGFKGQSNSYVAALFGRVLSPSTHYLLALGSDDKLALRKRVNSSSTGASIIGSAVAFTFAQDTWYDVHFEIIGANLKGCIGAVCVAGVDSSIMAGGVALGTVNTSARFDNVRVTAP